MEHCRETGEVLQNVIKKKSRIHHSLWWHTLSVFVGEKSRNLEQVMKHLNDKILTDELSTGCKISTLQAFKVEYIFNV